MDFERVELAPCRILGVHAVVPRSTLGEFFRPAFDALASEMDDHGVETPGPPIAVYHGPVTDTVDVTAGFPVAPLATPRSGSIIETLPGGAAVVAVHVGPYESIAETHARLLDWLAQQHLTPAAEMWEEYLVGPGDDPDPRQWQTRIVYPLA